MAIFTIVLTIESFNLNIKRVNRNVKIIFNERKVDKNLLHLFIYFMDYWVGSQQYNIANISYFNQTDINCCDFLAK